MQTQGSLAEANLASLLHTMQSERATGTLSLENGEATCALYFLFGHLFHAAGPSGQGEDVVIDALTWEAGVFAFDPRAKLPAEETIKSSPGDLIAEAQHRGGAPVTATQFAASGGATETTAVPGAATATAVPAYHSTWDSTPSPPPGGEVLAEPTADQAPAEEASIAPGDETPEHPDLDPPHDPPTYGSWDQPATRGPDDPATYTTWSPQPLASVGDQGAGHPIEEPAVVAAVADADADAGDGDGGVWSSLPTVEGGGSPSAGPHQPTPSAPACAGRAGDNARRRSTDFSTLGEVYPLPAGKPVYEGLKCSFVDFPKLLTTLRKDSHTGYVRLTGGEFTGVLLFHDGHLLEALAKESVQTQGESAFREIQRRMEAGEGLLDVIDLAGDTVAALAQLLMARPLFAGLLGRIINFKNLLEYLEEEKVDGSVIVATENDFGVILLRKGEVLGAYTKSNAILESTTGAIDALAAERAARIEVKGGAGEIVGIDVDRMLAPG